MSSLDNTVSTIRDIGRIEGAIIALMSIDFDVPTVVESCKRMEQQLLSTIEKFNANNKLIQLKVWDGVENPITKVYA